MTVGEVCLGGAKIVQNQAATASWRPDPRFMSGKVAHGSKTALVRLPSGPSLGVIWGMLVDIPKARL